jgi:hypothetical protein
VNIESKVRKERRAEAKRLKREAKLQRKLERAKNKPALGAEVKP